MIRLAKAFLLVIPTGCALLAQTQPSAATAGAPDQNKAGAYYNFAMGRVYSELADAEGNRNEYVSKAIQHYQEALKLDPTAGIVFEELTDLYIRTGRLRDAIAQAEDMLKTNPDNLDARRMLARIYFRAAGDPQSGKVDEANLRRAIEQYKIITEKDPKDTESLVRLGQLYRVSNNSPEAEKAFDAALKVEPENEEAVVQLALLYAELGDSKRSIEKLQSATSKNPNDRLLALLAEQYEQLHDYKSAAAALQKAYELAPDSDEIARKLAQDLWASGQPDEALKLYQQLAADDPRDLSLPLAMAGIYRSRHDFAKAKEMIAKAKAIDGESMEVRYQEVKLNEAQAKLDEALAGLKSILDDTARKTYSEAESQRRAGLFEEYGILLRNAEKYPQAVEAFKQIATLNAEAGQQAALQVIETYRTAKDYDSALRESDAAIKKFPEERGLKVEHAMVLADQGKVDAGAKELRALSKGPEDRDTQISLAQIYEKGKRYADMGKALDEAEKLSDSNDDKETVFFMRGAMYERMKKYDASETEFRKVLQLDPEHAGSLNYLGYMLADRGVRLEEAYQLIRKAVDLDPYNGAYLDSLGWVYFRQGKLTEAAETLQQAIDRMATDPTVHDHLGDVYFKLGKTKEAITQWQASLKAFQSGSQSDSDPEDMSKVSKKLDDARVRLAQETHKQK